eukprot:TRINITY_DN4999_c0_g1_i1.p1 TRINITY_DN4999_c0_g1~~TRINITY_DN4999_c0_g1_i1.p1  ORF type:complete len:448 (+),score=150.61 TRINITY_DN4999_c0_g1_i1:183-1526(+)
MGHQHGDSCNHGHGDAGGGGGGGHSKGGGGHSHGHGGIGALIKGIDLPSIVLIGLITNVLFWMFSSATTIPSIIALYTLVCAVVFAVLLRNNAQGRLSNRMLPFITNFVGANAMIFLISLLFVGIEVSKGYKQVLIHVDMSSFELEPSYLKDFFGELKTRGSTGVLLEIDPKHKHLEEIAHSLDKSGLELVPIVSGRHQVEDVRSWLSSSVKFNKIHVGDPDLGEMESIFKSHPEKNVTFLMWDSIARDDSKKIPLEDKRYQYVIHPDHSTEVESEEASNWKIWQSFKSAPLWASCYYDDSDVFAIGEQAQNVWRWVEIERLGKISLNGIIIMSKKVKENHMGSLLPLNLPLIALDLEVIRVRTDYRFIKKKVFHSLGLGNLHLTQISKTVAGASSRKGDFVGADLFQLAAQFEQSKEPKTKEELKRELVPKYYKSLPSFLNAHQSE